MHDVRLWHLNKDYLLTYLLTRLAKSTGRKKSPKIRHLGTVAQLSDYIFGTKAHIDNRKKLVKQQYLPHMSSQYGELRPTSG